MYKTALGIIISLLLITIIIIFCIVIVKLYIQRIKEHNIKEINFQKTLNSSIVETQEQLLTSISQDLHDDAGQQLTVINFQLENLKIDYPNCVEELSLVSESVGKLSQSLRQISHSLNSNWLEKNGLIEAMHHEMNRLKKNKSIEVVFNVDDASKGFKNDEQIVIFRIFQEVINNILKYAKASKIEVSINFKPKIKIIITDNGIGFDTEKLSENNNSIGIQNCINRAKVINYSFQIDSTVNQGTTIILQENK